MVRGLAAGRSLQTPQGLRGRLPEPAPRKERCLGCRPCDSARDRAVREIARRDAGLAPPSGENGVIISYRLCDTRYDENWLCLRSFMGLEDGVGSEAA